MINIINSENNRKIVFPKEIKEYLSEIQGLYQNLQKYFFKYFIFSEENSKEIIERYNSINNNLKHEDSNNIKEYKSLLKPIKEFSEKIKKSYENSELTDIFNKLKEANTKIIIYTNSLDDELNNSSQSDNITPQIESNEIEEEKNKSNYFYNLSNSSNNKKIEEKKYQISLTCNICSGEAQFICNNHCFNYFCNSCTNKNNEQDINGHHFEKINIIKEKEKIQCINSIFYMIKNLVEIADQIFKLNEEKIEYPILRNPDKIDSQKEFISNINNLKIIDQSSLDKSIKPVICQPLKTFLIETFDLSDISSEFKPNERELSISEENFNVFSINYNENETNLNKIKNSIDLIANKYANNENIKFIEKEIKNFKGLKKDVKNIFNSLFKK